MKNVFFKSLTTFILLIAFTSSDAQQSSSFPRVRAVLLKSQLDEVKRRVHIDEKNIAAFDKIYESYINEISLINNNNIIPSLYTIKLDKYSDNEIEAIFMQQSEKARKLLAIREKYFWIFRSILSSKDVVRVFLVEREVIDQAQQEIRRRSKSNVN